MIDTIFLTVVKLTAAIIINFVIRIILLKLSFSKKKQINLKLEFNFKSTSKYQ